MTPPAFSWKAFPPGPTTDVAFSPEAIYELRLDTNGDNVADIAYRVRFTSSQDGAQTATLRRAEGAQVAEMGDEGQVIVEGAPSRPERRHGWRRPVTTASSPAGEEILFLRRPGSPEQPAIHR